MGRKPPHRLRGHHRSLPDFGGQPEPFSCLVGMRRSFASDEVESRFVFLNLSGRYEEIRAISNSGGQKNLSQALVRDLPFAYPKERAEQHRIAECLTALDNQIAAQSRKLDTLKHHKQGLMQQLFPSLETK